MLISFFKSMNWFDIFIVILILRASFVAAKTGISVEFFKFLGIIMAVFCALHYYAAAALSLEKILHFDSSPTEFIEFLACLIIALLVYLAVVALRKAFFLMFKIEAQSAIAKWGGFFLGLLRGMLISSLIMFLFAISSIGYLKKSVATSYLGSRYYNTAPQVYSYLWENLVGKFAANEKFNKAVLELKNTLKKEGK
jgi:uncharacterized membrane protein required for colicin V production